MVEAKSCSGEVSPEQASCPCGGKAHQSRTIVFPSEGMKLVEVEVLSALFYMCTAQYIWVVEAFLRLDVIILVP